MTTRAGERDRPPGAGAASWRTEGQPRLPEPLGPALANLAALLAAITDEGQRQLAAVNEDLACQFAARLAFIRRFTPRPLLGAALRALREEQEMAIAAARERIRAETQARKAAAGWQHQQRRGGPHPGM